MPWSVMKQWTEWKAVAAPALSRSRISPDGTWRECHVGYHILIRRNALHTPDGRVSFAPEARERQSRPVRRHSR